MDIKQRQVIIAMKKDIVNNADPLTIVSQLTRNGEVSSGVYDCVNRLFVQGKQRKDVMTFLVDCLPAHVSFNSFLLTLDRCGYHQLTSRLFMKGYEIHVQTVPTFNAEDRSKLQQFYRNLKHMVHDSQFNNPRNALRTLARRYKHAVEVETDEQRRQKLADKCVAILGVEIDAHYDSLACESERTQEEMLAEMKELASFTSNTLITDTIFLSRQANLDGFHGDFQHAERMLQGARTSAQNIGHCLELVNMLYIEVYVKLWQFELQPSRNTLDAIMMWGRIGLESLKWEEDATQVLWRRMFILRMVFALLGLGNRCNILHSVDINSSDIAEATKLLATFDRDWEGIEIRREMFYCVARARLYEQKNLFHETLMFIKRAKSLAEQGRFLEKIPFIEELKELIQSHFDAVPQEQITFRSNTESVLQPFETNHSTTCTNTDRKELLQSESAKRHNVNTETRTEPKCIMQERVMHEKVCLSEIQPGAVNIECNQADNFSVAIMELKSASETDRDSNSSVKDKGKYDKENVQCREDLLNERMAQSFTSTKKKYVNEISGCDQETELLKPPGEISETTPLTNVSNPMWNFWSEYRRQDDLNSIALFEEREEPEGASQSSSNLAPVHNTSQSNLSSLAQEQPVSQSKLSNLAHVQPVNQLGRQDSTISDHPDLRLGTGNEGKLVDLLDPDFDDDLLFG